MNPPSSNEIEVVRELIRIAGDVRRDPTRHAPYADRVQRAIVMGSALVATMEDEAVRDRDGNQESTRMDAELTREEYEAVEWLMGATHWTGRYCDVLRDMLARRRPKPDISALTRSFFANPCLATRKPLWEALAGECDNAKGMPVAIGGHDSRAEVILYAVRYDMSEYAIKVS